MEFLSSLNPWLYAFMIMLLRICDMSLDTIRVLFVVRGKKLLVFILGFFQSVIFVVAISSVLTKMGNILNVLGYALGFATGNVVGMLIENRLAIGHILVTIISSTRGTSIAERLRASGYAVTEISGAVKTAPFSSCTLRLSARMWTLWKRSCSRPIRKLSSPLKTFAPSGADSSAHKLTLKTNNDGSNGSVVVFYLFFWRCALAAYSLSGSRR